VLHISALLIFLVTVAVCFARAPRACLLHLYPTPPHSRQALLRVVFARSTRR